MNPRLLPLLLALGASLAQAAPELETLAEQAQSVTLSDHAQISPLTELLQSAHDRLYSRLFQS